MEVLAQAEVALGGLGGGVSQGELDLLKRGLPHETEKIVR